MSRPPGYNVIPNDWINLEYIINDLCTRVIKDDITQSLGTGASPTFAGITLSGLGAGYVKSSSAGLLSSGAIAAADLPAHDLVGAVHTVSGLTTGHVLTASGATTYGFAALPAYVPAGAALLLDQTSPQTFTSGTVTGTGLLKVTAGLLGLDTNTYYKSGDSPSFAGLTITGLSASQAVMTDGSKNLVSADYLNQAVKTTSSPSFVDTTLTGILKLPTTSSTVGQIQQNSVRVLHTFGTQNIFLGKNAGNFTLTVAEAVNNVGIGDGALLNLTTGNVNMGIGYYALNSCTDGVENMALGSNALSALVTGGSNVAVGSFSLWKCTSSYNTFIGSKSGYSLTSGVFNTGIGPLALFSATTAVANVAIGMFAGYLNNAHENIFIGHCAGYRQTAGNRLVLDRGIGAEGRANATDELANAIIFGIMADAYTSQSLYLNANVGINRNGVAPTVALDVTGAALISTTLGVTGLSTLTGGATTGGARSIKVETVTGTATVAATSELVICNSASNFALALEQSVGAGRKIFIKNINTGIVTVTPLATGTADLIDGETTQTLNQWDCMEICSYVVDRWAII
jgi:hypothetical protein